MAHPEFGCPGFGQTAHAEGDQRYPLPGEQPNRAGLNRPVPISAARFEFIASGQRDRAFTYDQQARCRALPFKYQVEWLGHGDCRSEREHSKHVDPCILVAGWVQERSHDRLGLLLAERCLILFLLGSRRWLLAKGDAGNRLVFQ